MTQRRHFDVETCRHNIKNEFIFGKQVVVQMVIIDNTVEKTARVLRCKTIVKPLIVPFSSPSSYFIPFRYKYSAQNPDSRNSQSVFIS